MKFRTQRVSYLFFATALALFALQILFGFIMAFAHMGYDVLHEVIPFNAARTTHLNLLVFWLLAGFMGSAYYIVPEEAEQELYSEKLAIIQWAGLVIVGVTAVIGFQFGWWEGRKFLEIPRPLDYLVVVDILLFLYIVGRTALSAPRFTTTGSVLLLGLTAAALLYLPGMITFESQVIDSYFRWWVVHLWVEGCLGADHGRDALLPVDQAHRRRSGADREVALRDHRIHVPVGHPGNRVTTTTTSAAPEYWLRDRRRLLGPRAAGLPGDGALRRDDGPARRHESPQPHRALLDGGLWRDVLRGRRLPGLCPHPARR